MNRLTLWAVLLTCLLLTVSTVHADGWQDRLSATIVGAVNAGPVLGAALSYQATDHLWLDLGAKRAEGETQGFLGASTDLQQAALLIDALLQTDVGTMPASARIGAACDTDGGMFGYLAYSIGF